MEKESDQPTPENTSAAGAAPEPESGKKITASAEAATAKASAPEKPLAGRGAGNRPPGPSKPKKSGFRRFLTWLVIIALLAGAGYAGWIFYGREYKEELVDRYWPFKKESAVIRSVAPEAEITEPSDVDIGPVSEPEVESTPGIAAAIPLEQSVQQQNALDNSADVERIESRLDRLAAQVADNQLELTSQQQRLHALSTTTREDWLLSEAEYLIRLASQRILTERQTRNALALLESADAILMELDQPDLFAVRAAVARDITNLRMAGMVDREGLYLKLDALIKAVPQLEVARAEAVTAAPEEDVVWYRQLAANAWNALTKLSGIKRVERVDAPLDPVLLPSEEAMAQLNIRLALEQAQISLMREEQAIYDAGLKRAGEYVEEYFGDAPVAAVFQEDIRALSGAIVTQPLPSVAESIAALQDYIHRWHNRYEPVGVSAPAGASPDETEPGQGESEEGEQ